MIHVKPEEVGSDSMDQLRRKEGRMLWRYSIPPFSHLILSAAIKNIVLLQKGLPIFFTTNLLSSVPMRRVTSLQYL